MKNESPLISIIIPVYNSGKYLNKCLDSIINQTYNNIEIIVVDDGSTDNSLKIIGDYQKRDDRIVLIKQNNQFAGVARNNGLKVARGDYILFLDSDDFFSKKLCDVVKKDFEEYDVDFIEYDFCWFDETTNKKKHVKKNKYGIFRQSDLTPFLFQKIEACPWTKAYKKSFLDSTGIMFQALLNSNDIYFTFLNAMAAKKILISDKELVYYRYNNKDSLQGKSSENISCIFEALDSIYKSIKCHGYVDRYNKTFGICVSSIIMGYISKKMNYGDLKDLFYLASELYINCSICLVDFDNVSEFEKKINEAFLDKDFSRFIFMLYEKERDVRNKNRFVNVLRHPIWLLDVKLKKH